MRRMAMISGLGLAAVLFMSARVQASEPKPVPSPDLPSAPADQKARPKSCVAFQKVPEFSNWVAKVSDAWISTLNGSVDVIFQVGGTRKFEQVMQTSNPLYPTVSKLRTGQLVRISGRYVHGNGECDYELAATGVVLTSVKVIK